MRLCAVIWAQGIVSAWIPREKRTTGPEDETGGCHAFCEVYWPPTGLFCRTRQGLAGTYLWPRMTKLTERE
jgi:hypothetical protein